MVRWLTRNRPEVKKIGLIYPNDAVGQTVSTVLAGIYKAQGYEVIGEGYERGAKEFTSLIARMMARGIDVLDLNSNAPVESGLLVKQARQSGFEKLIWQIGGPSIDEIIEVAGPLAEGFLSLNLVDYNEPGAARFEKAYREKYGSGVINAFAPTYYNATKIFLETLRRAGTVTDVTKIRDTLETKLDGYDPGVLGPVVWGGMADYGVKHQLFTNVWIAEVQNGKVVTKATISPEPR
jgi:branched-chain amino acid transport system substrate-binding protein